MGGPVGRHGFDPVDRRRRAAAEDKDLPGEARRRRIVQGLGKLTERSDTGAAESEDLGG